MKYSRLLVCVCVFYHSTCSHSVDAARVYQAGTVFYFSREIKGQLQGRHV